MSFQNNITSENSVNGLIDLAFIAIGSNLSSRFGSPQEVVQQAMDALENLSQQPLQRSSLWQSKPQACPADSPDFVNAVVSILPLQQETPDTLLGKLLELEKDFGRERPGETNAPRSLDLDLICFGRQVSQNKTLVLPHPAAHVRNFVLTPLAEIAPNLILPGQSRSVLELAEKRLKLDAPLIKLDS